ncbi:stimulated by retinoic acid gene 8 protein homolog isoform X3 [Hoplias malabaricus]|uniref:stimulated by retinoic acid gene 8 protein homolog isoform X3 n=1 Tax=Hoplias malabaricus TaxID=27720 RepID=UPI003462C23C
MSFRGVAPCSSRGKKKRPQACQRVTLTDLFESLKNVVCPSIQKTPAKWKILDHAKGFLLEKEAYLSKLLALKVFLKDDEGPKNLEEVREQYRRLYSKCFRCSRRAHIPDEDNKPENSGGNSADEEIDAALQSQSSGLSVSNIQEFEGQTQEHLLHSGILAPEQIDLAVVSEAISGLWNSLLPEQSAAIQHSTLNESSATCVEPDNNTPCSSPNSSQLTSLNATGTSAFEETVYDVVQRDMDASSPNSPSVLLPENGQYDSQIFKDIIDFIRRHICEDQKLTQGRDLTPDCEELFLWCCESFDEDL